MPIVSANRIPFRRERIQNAILFFARKHAENTGNPLYQTYLYKYLAFLEFWSIRETGVPAFGLTYRAMKNGPVPLELYDESGEFRTSPLYRFDYDGDGRVSIAPIGFQKANLDFFSSTEIKRMRYLVQRFATDFSKTSEISEASHREIIAWKKARENALMNYEDEMQDAQDSAIEMLSIHVAFQAL